MQLSIIILRPLFSYNPLMIASQKDHLNVVELLVSKGAQFVCA